MEKKSGEQSEAFWVVFERFALLFSFTMNIILLIVVLVLVGLIVPVKNQIAQPVMDKMMAEIDRLGNAHIKTTIVVEDEIQVKFDLPLDKEIDVKTTDIVPMTSEAYFTLPNGGGYIRGTVNIDLPADTTLPVRLNTTVPVDQIVPVRLEVPVDIALADTDLKVSVDNFKALLAPLNSLVSD
jgi:hypothetical protein